jgi:hypothetical protein
MIATVFFRKKLQNLLQVEAGRGTRARDTEL